MTSINEILKSKRLNPKQLRSLLDLLKRHQSTGLDLKKTLVAEHWFELHGIAGWDTDNVKVLKVQLTAFSFFLDDATIKSINDMRKGAISREGVLRKGSGRVVEKVPKEIHGTGGTDTRHGANLPFPEQDPFPKNVEQG